MEIRDRFSIVVLENECNEVLLLKRSPEAVLGPGMWGFPAGHIEKPESPDDCADRELKEEIGTNYLIRLINQIGPIRDTFYGGIYEIYLYHFRWLNGEITLNDEHTDYAWVSKTDYKNYKVMDGIDEDLFYLKLWPEKYLNKNKLPTASN